MLRTEPLVLWAQYCWGGAGIAPGSVNMNHPYRCTTVAPWIIDAAAEMKWNFKAASLGIFFMML